MDNYTTLIYHFMLNTLNNNYNITRTLELIKYTVTY